METAAPADILTVLVSWSLAQRTTGEVAVTVRSADGSPLPNATVRVDVDTVIALRDRMDA